MLIKSELDKLGLHYTRVELGETEIIEDISSEQMDCLGAAVKTAGIELIGDNKNILVEKIKSTIIELVYNTDDKIKINVSDYLSQKLNHSYLFLSHLFSEVKGITVEKFYLVQKIERVKDLLVLDKINLTEIAYKLHYSSVAHLSNQFSKITGFTPSHFKNLNKKRRNTLEQI